MPNPVARLPLWLMFSLVWPGGATAAELPEAAWTAHFTQLREAGEWRLLAGQLGALRAARPAAFERASLGYLQARALYESGQFAAAQTALEPYLAPDQPLRDLALEYAARTAAALGDGVRASQLRDPVIFARPAVRYRAEATADELERLFHAGDAAGLEALATRLKAAGEPESRDLEARTIELLATSQPAAALSRGRAVLASSISDDAAERVMLALDRPELIAQADPEVVWLLGECALAQRHLARARGLLALALPRLPARRDEIAFAIGRALFWEEDYAAAEKAFLQAASSTRQLELRATLLFHAARCAQMLRDDARAERQLTSAIAIGGRSPKTSAALTQRLRTRLRQKRYLEAGRDLALLEQRFPRHRARYEGTLAYALAMLAEGRDQVAVAALGRLPPYVRRRSDEPELDYWRARALERSDPRAAAGHYLRVLQRSSPFEPFARERVQGKPLAGALGELRARLQAQLEERVAAGEDGAAAVALADLVRLSGDAERAGLLGRLQQMCVQSPGCRATNELASQALPQFPLAEPFDRLDLLLALGLADDALDLVPARFSLNPASAALTRARVLALAGERQRSVRAAELALASAPATFLPELIGWSVQELLYPRPYPELVHASATEHGADPLLVFAVMREESRFNPRARSAAAARGLMQLVLDTARSVAHGLGRPELAVEELYEPAVAVSLGARYLGDLQRRFAGDRYAVAAAYNAGPNQVELWQRLLPAPGDDYFYSLLNFDETKDYVGKVIESYRHYAALAGRPPG